MAGELFRSSEASAFVCARGGIAASLNTGCVNEKLERIFLLYMQLPRKFISISIQFTSDLLF